MAEKEAHEAAKANGETNGETNGEPNEENEAASKEAKEPDESKKQAEQADRAASGGAGAGAGDDSGSNSIDELLRDVLGHARTIAVVGMKRDPGADAHRVPSYMREHGYVVVPVNPKFDRVDELEAYPDVVAANRAGLTIDVVNLFRASENVEAHVDEILQMKPAPRAVWMQLGIHHGASAKRLRDAGIDVVQDRCIMVDHRRLFGRPEGDATRAS